MNEKINPITIKITGNFWDCFLYRNRLFLSTMDNKIRIFDWKKNVEQKYKIDFGVKCAFLNSDYLYKIKDKELFEDLDFKKLAAKKIEKLGDTQISLEEIECKGSLNLEQLTIDYEIFFNRLYYSDSSGFYVREINFKNKNPISKYAMQLWDKPVQNISIASTGRIALSLSNDGLYEFNNKGNYCGKVSNSVHKTDEGAIYKISDEHSTSCEWAHSTMINFSYSNKTHIFPFYWKNGKKDTLCLKKCALIPLDNIFEIKHNDAIYVGGNDKIYSVSNDGIEGFFFYQRNLANKDIKSAFRNIEDIKLIPFKLNGSEYLIQSEVADFGIIIETNIKLYVIESNSVIHEFGNENDKIVKWRVYPRSNCYSNQLHIVFCDRLEIISFNNDCFISQKNKPIGQKHMTYNLE